jgi:hypothetical protein
MLYRIHGTAARVAVRPWVQGNCGSALALTCKKPLVRARRSPLPAVSPASSFLRYFPLVATVTAGIAPGYLCARSYERAHWALYAAVLLNFNGIGSCRTLLVPERETRELCPRSTSRQIRRIEINSSACEAAESIAKIVIDGVSATAFQAQRAWSCWWKVLAQAQLCAVFAP